MHIGLNNSYIRTNPNAMRTVSTIDEKLLERYMAEATDPDLLQDELRRRGFSQEEAGEIITALKKKKRASRYTNGMILIFGGGGIGFIGCLSILLNIAPEWYYWMLYCPTCLACLLICWGLYLIVE